MTEKKGKLTIGLVDGEMKEKVKKFTKSIMDLAQEQDLEIQEVCVALDMIKKALEHQGFHSAVIMDKKDEDN